MADGTIGIKQAVTPDRLVDNDVLQNANGDTVYRQKVLAPDTDAALELIRAQVAAVNANTDAVEALLTTMRDEQMRRTDPLAAGTNVVGKVQLDAAVSNYVSPGGSVKVAQGKLFIGGKAVVMGGLASTDRPVFRLYNPVGSGKNLHISKIVVYSTTAQQVKYNEDGTITSEGTITPFNFNRALATPPASVAELTHARTGVTGGTEWPNESRVAPDAPLILDFGSAPLPLGQGKAMLVRGTVGDSQTFTVNAYWFEEPV